MGFPENPADGKITASFALKSRYFPELKLVTYLHVSFSDLNKKYSYSIFKSG